MLNLRPDARPTRRQQEDSAEEVRGKRETEERGSNNPKKKDSDMEAWTVCGASAPKRKQGHVYFPLPKGQTKPYFNENVEEGVEAAPKKRLSPRGANEADADRISYRHQEALFPGKSPKEYCCCRHCELRTAINPCAAIPPPAEEDKALKIRPAETDILCDGQEDEVTKGHPSVRPRQDHGIWGRDMPRGMMPLSRLSSLVAFGETSFDVTH